jgi:hypothetical protein
MGVDMQALSERTWALVEAAIGPAHAASHCLYYAAAARGALGAHYRFKAGGAFLRSSEMQGWGIIVNPGTGSFMVTADQYVDPEDGSYCGHCWVEFGIGEVMVVDLMDGYIGPRQSMTPPIVYHAIPALLRSIKGYYGEKLALVERATRKNKDFAAEVRRAVAEACPSVIGVAA